MLSKASDVVITTEPRLALNHETRRVPHLSRLIQDARDGDASAFDQIMICYQRRVYSVAWRILGNREDAMDAVQDTFLRVYRYLKSYRASEDFDGWLYRIAVNVCRDIARKRGTPSPVFSELDIDQESVPQAGAETDIESRAIRQQQLRIVSAALDTLSKKEREALVLRDLEGLATEEVARILGSSQTTVRSQISSARRKIKLFKDRLMNERRG